MAIKPTRRDLLIGLGAVGALPHLPVRAWSAQALPRPSLFVDEKGGDDGRDGRTPDTAWRTLARVNRLGSGAAGEVVGLARGGLWREALYVPAPRMTFVPYGAGAKPIICGAELKVRWIEDGPLDSARRQSRSWRTYSVRQEEDPGEQVFVDDMRLSPATSRRDMEESSFWWDAAGGRLHVRLRRDADPAGHRIEVSKEALCCEIAGIADVTVRDIVFEKARRWGLKGRDGAARLKAIGCEFLRNGGNGIHVGDGSNAGEKTIENPDVAVIGCRAAWNLGSGIVGLNRVTGMRILRSVAHHNCQSESPGDFSGNIRIISDFVPGTEEVPQNRPADCLIEQCVSHSAGKDPDGRTIVSSERGHGIWLDTAGPRSFVRNCRSFGNAKSGVYYEWGGPDCSGGLEGNLAYGNETGVLLARRTSGAVVRNNTALHNGNGLWITGEWGGERDLYGFRDNEVYNNIAVDNRIELLVSWGAEASGNLFHHNCFGRQRQDFVSWGLDNRLDTYDALERAYGAPMHNVEADPVLVLSEAGELSVSPGSPIKGAAADGSDLGADPSSVAQVNAR